MKTTLRLHVSVALLAAALSGASSVDARQSAPAPTPTLSLSDPVPFDAAVTMADLPNGLRYYIRKNGRPEKRVLMQLAVKAGSVDETEQQRGLAHFLEHMAFNGTRRFKAGELIAALEQTGARMGPHVNAYTSFDETVYMFQLPTDRPDIVDKGIQALADFAGGMTLDPGEIDKERGVVIEEWRGDLGAGARVRDQHIPVLYYQSRYAERLPIGKPEILKSFTPDVLRAFYTKWYRPDRMAVVVVGDVDTSQIEQLIKKEFGSIPKPESAPPERNYPVPLTDDLLTKTATDPEVTQSSVSILRKRPADPSDRVTDYRASLVRQLVFQMLNERFDEIARKPDAPFLSAAAYSSSLSPTVTTFALGAGVQDGKIEAGLSALAVEGERVERHGFGQAEFDRARSWLVAGYDRAYAERDKAESGSYVEEYINHFLLNEPSPGIVYEHQLVKSLIPGITVQETSDAARTLLLDQSRVILAVSPQKPNLKIPSDAELRAAVKAAEAVAVTAWNDAGTGRALMEHIPDPGTVAGRREIPELAVSVVRFANGVEAWLKPTDFKNDQILFSLVSSGGSSLAEPAKFVEAQFASTFAQLSGAGGHRAVDLEKLLAGKIASANASISLSSHGIAGSSTPANLETALQLLNLRFTAPGDDPEAFALIRRQLEAALINRDRNPSIVFNEKVASVNSMDHYTSRPLTNERVQAMDRQAMTAFYRERFANAADFTFFMVGAFKIDDAVPLVARYVGSLPSTGKMTARFKDVGLRFPPTTVRERVEKGKEPKSHTILSFFADPPIEENEQSRLEAATEVLEIRLRDVLREELGETYSVSVGTSQPLPQRGGGRVVISFGAAPENVDRMVERIFQEIRLLQTGGPSEDLTTRAKESARREHETLLKENGFWLGRLQSAKLLERDPLLILKRMERIESITPAALQEVFKKYFPMDRNTVITLLPEQH
jgi:zinc protease